MTWRWLRWRHDEGIERVGWERRRDDPAADHQANRQLFAEVILHDDHETPIRIGEGELVFVAVVAGSLKYSRARPDEMAHMLHQVVLVVVDERLCCGVHRHQRILRPPPTAQPSLLHGQVPVQVRARAVPQVVLHLRPGVPTIPPVVSAVPALLLGLVEPEIRVEAVDDGNGPLPRPLNPRALDVFARLGVAQAHLDEPVIGPLQRPHEDLHPALGHLGAQVRDETREALGGPGATGEHLRGVELVLRHDHPDGDALLAVLVHKAAEIGGVGAEIALLLEKHVGPLFADLVRLQTVAHALEPRYRHRCRVVLVGLHPGRRAPWRRPEPQVGLMRERTPDKRDERLEVVGNAEVLEGEITRHLIIRVPAARDIVGADRHAAEGEVGAHSWGKQFAEDAVSLLRVEDGE